MLHEQSTGCPGAGSWLERFTAQPQSPRRWQPGLTQSRWASLPLGHLGGSWRLLQGPLECAGLRSCSLEDGVEGGSSGAATVAGACAVVVVVVVVEAAMAAWESELDESRATSSPTVAAGPAPAVVVSGNPVALVTLVRATLATAVPLILPTLGVLVRGGGSARGLRRGG
ncbi:hypothetical protein B0O80DRAFT_461004 [Mortierella sp. GBAus27b]|nr:hypothetical protein B0O80DRAFT_461004 [Mortierella sp. GBAus27b]